MSNWQERIRELDVLADSLRFQAPQRVIDAQRKMRAEEEVRVNKLQQAMQGLGIGEALSSLNEEIWDAMGKIETVPGPASYFSTGSSVVARLFFDYNDYVITEKQRIYGKKRFKISTEDIYSGGTSYTPDGPVSWSDYKGKKLSFFEEKKIGYRVLGFDVKDSSRRSSLSVKVVSNAEARGVAPFDLVVTDSEVSIPNFASRFGMSGVNAHNVSFPDQTYPGSISFREADIDKAREILMAYLAYSSRERIQRGMLPRIYREKEQGRESTLEFYRSRVGKTFPSS